MPLARSRDYLSIGEVLDLLRADFPDISISKIRFLEAEGLIAPERTGSKYRKFYDPDVTQLRYILALQRDHFLPLKVIREKLAEMAANGGEASALRPAPPPRGDAPQEPVVDLTAVQMDRSELEASASLSEKQLDQLCEFGILDAKQAYDENDLAVARGASKFMAYGVEPRHLRMFKQTAEREAGFIQQIVSPVSRRRDQEEAHKQILQSVRELLALSRQVREALLRAALRDLL
ncbi:MAG: MerR family transcriptional regulator [Actinomycetota bacterium]|nr:MerR family transcriptional regulator [Actinomycetota bacterium]